MTANILQMRPNSPGLRLLILGITSLFITLGLSARARANDGALVWGTWYVALDAGPFIPGLDNGLVFLSALATLNRDGTALFYDGGDLGDMNFGTTSTPQQGVWSQSGRTIKITTLFIEADVFGVVQKWVKVNTVLEVGQDHDRLDGYVASLSELACDLNLGIPAPSPLRCPDPIANANAFVPQAFPPPGVKIPVHFSRLRVDQ